MKDVSKVRFTCDGRYADDALIMICLLYIIHIYIDINMYV